MRPPEWSFRLLLMPAACALGIGLAEGAARQDLAARVVADSVAARGLLGR